jgi:hypothetical protein
VAHRQRCTQPARRSMHACPPLNRACCSRACLPLPPLPLPLLSQTKNAHRRLHASILEGRHLAPADGGPAELQDLMRVFLSLAGCDTRDAALFKPLTAAATALLPDIMAAAAAEPPPDAVAQRGDCDRGWLCGAAGCRRWACAGRVASAARQAAWHYTSYSGSRNKLVYL